ncbi:hypothetical protein FACS1894166_06180 [Bacilli bacterium]|nr:hypothetical protein FACS1894166_06180 [Bacilli bacterium]
MGANHIGGFYSFADLIGNWNAVLAFVCIMFAVFGAIINRKSKQLKVAKSKTFMFGAIVSTVIVGVGLLAVMVNSAGDFVYTLGYYQGFISYPPDYHPSSVEPKVTTTDVVGSAFHIIIALIFIGAMLIPAAVRVHQDNRKNIHFNSHKQY